MCFTCVLLSALDCSLFTPVFTSLDTRVTAYGAILSCYQFTLIWTEDNTVFPFLPNKKNPFQQTSINLLLENVKIIVKLCLMHFRRNANITLEILFLIFKLSWKLLLIKWLLLQIMRQSITFFFVYFNSIANREVYITVVYQKE